VQYDIELVHSIEAVVGHELKESTALEEAAVLKGITRVFSAKRAAALRAAEVPPYPTHLAQPQYAPTQPCPTVPNLLAASIQTTYRTSKPCY